MVTANSLQRCIGDFSQSWRCRAAQSVAAQLHAHELVGLAHCAGWSLVIGEQVATLHSRMALLLSGRVRQQRHMAQPW